MHTLVKCATTTTTATAARDSRSASSSAISNQTTRSALHQTVKARDNCLSCSSSISFADNLKSLAARACRCGGASATAMYELIATRTGLAADFTFLCSDKRSSHSMGFKDQQIRDAYLMCARQGLSSLELTARETGRPAVMRVQLISLFCISALAVAASSFLPSSQATQLRKHDRENGACDAKQTLRSQRLSHIARESTPDLKRNLCIRGGSTSSVPVATALTTVRGSNAAVAHPERPQVDAEAYRKAVLRTCLVLASAVAFGLGTMVVKGRQSGLEFFAGYLVEQSLSVDNLFV
eukprot:16426-Heterococcus_DN1.PRE.5